jgi:hypothetical protein
MLKLRNITGTKVVKGVTEEAIIASPTLGDLKITPLAADKLGIKEGDFVVLLTDDETNEVYIGKGIKGTELLDENGVAVKDARGRGVYDEANPGYGAVARRSTANSPLLKITGATAWNMVGGSVDHNTFCSLGEAQEGEVPTDNGEVFRGVFFKLTQYKQKAKSKKGPKAEGVEGDEDEDESDILGGLEAEGEGFVEEEV